MRRMLLFAAALWLLAVAPSAAADTGTRQGWWTTLNPGGLPPSLTGPDVPADGFLVQGGPSDASPVAIAALLVPVAAGGDARTLVVHAASGGGNVPGSLIKACRLTSADFRPDQGGAISSAPAYDCGDAVAVRAGADGVTYSFDVRKLLANGTVAAALVPGSALTRVVFAKPGVDVLLYASSAPAGPVAGPAAGGDTASPAVPSAAVVPGSAAVPPSPARSPASSSPTMPSVPARRTTAAATAVAPRPAASSSGTLATNPLALALLLAAVAAAGTAWATAGSDKRLPAPAATGSFT